MTQFINVYKKSQVAMCSKGSRTMHLWDRPHAVGLKGGKGGKKRSFMKLAFKLLRVYVYRYKSMSEYAIGHMHIVQSWKHMCPYSNNCSGHN